MSSWTDGYVSDIQYTSGFYRELAPSLLTYIGLIMGIRAPTLDREFTYCELACGQGFGTNVLAAANPQGRFYAYDFNPAQIANAQTLAHEAGLTNITFGEESFESLASKPDGALPQFDFITLHGIYSWISEANRHHIVRFIQRQLKAGGMVYVSYNTMPGWAAVAPMQRLMREHAARHPARSDKQVEAALAFLNRLKDAGARYFQQNPSIAPRMEKLGQHNRHYLAHEYLNGFWFPLYHADVVREMDEAKLNFVGSAHIFENIDAVSVPPDIRPIVAEATDPVMAQTLRDFAINQQFRRDVFVRGASALTASEALNASRQLALHVSGTFPEGDIKFQTPLGEAAGNAAIYNPLKTMFEEQQQLTLNDAITNTAFQGQALNALSQAFAMLVGATLAHPVLPEVKGKSAAAAKTFNRIVAQRVVNGADFSFLAAPKIGTGIPAGFTDMASLFAVAQNVKPGVDELLAAVWQMMAQTGRRLIHEGKTLQTQEETLPVLRRDVETFVNKKLPLWRKLGII